MGVPEPQPSLPVLSTPRGAPTQTGHENRQGHSICTGCDSLSWSRVAMITRWYHTQRHVNQERGSCGPHSNPMTTKIAVWKQHPSHLETSPEILERAVWESLHTHSAGSQWLLGLKSFHKQDALSPLLRICNDFTVYACTLNQWAWMTWTVTWKFSPAHLKPLSYENLREIGPHCRLLLTSFGVRPDTAFLTNTHRMGGGGGIWQWQWYGHSEHPFPAKIISSVWGHPMFMISYISVNRPQEIEL